jgi:osmotically-inducible protein OsmY
MSQRNPDDPNINVNRQEAEDTEQSSASYIPTSFEGIGPQGYRRSDEDILEDVCKRLTRHGYVDASKIQAEVHEGEVVLKGTVPDRRMKRMAEDAIETIAGVFDVHNQLRIQRDR